MVQFTEGEKKGDSRVILFPNGTVFLNPGKPVINFKKHFTKGFLGQIFKILKDQNYILYTQVQQGTAEQALICILGETTVKTFNDARAEFNGKTLAKVCGDVFTLSYMTEDNVKEFITKISALTFVDANTTEKDEYVKYNTIPVFDKAITSASSVAKPIVMSEYPAIGASVSVSASASASASASKRWGEIPLTPEQKKKPEISSEAKAELFKLETDLSVKMKEVVANKEKFAELQKQVSAIQKQLETDEAAIVKARNILNKKRELAILEAE
jgi:hypothetical protein